MTGEGTQSTRWTKINEESGDGVSTFRLNGWSAFFTFLQDEVFSDSAGNDYVWRGQRCSDWPLSSSLDRVFAKLGLVDQTPAELDVSASERLVAFKRAARGRRGQNPPQLNDDQWWALGQHYGLATPLLDWMKSPFAAAYFAFEEDNPYKGHVTEHRAIYGLHRRAVSLKSEQIVAESNTGRRDAIIDFIDPFSDDNPRLVSQGGMFTRAPVGQPIEMWVQRAFEGSQEGILLRIEVPNADRLACLRTLDRMNINHLSLFPDLVGASRFVNLEKELESTNG